MPLYVCTLNHFKGVMRHHSSLFETAGILFCLLLPPLSLSLSLSFADECDALLGRRGEGENDAMRRLKNEFLQCFDGVGVASVDCFTN